MLSSRHGMVVLPPDDLLVPVRLRNRAVGRLVYQRPRGASALREKHHLAVVTMLRLLRTRPHPRQYPHPWVSPPSWEVPILPRTLLRAIPLGGTCYGPRLPRTLSG